MIVTWANDVGLNVKYVPFRILKVDHAYNGMNQLLIVIIEITQLL